MTTSVVQDSKDQPKADAERAAIAKSLTIRYRRPEAPWSMVKMTVPSGEEAQIQTARLEALGYSVMDVT
jgi:hypothetical protein